MIINNRDLTKFVILLFVLVQSTVYLKAQNKNANADFFEQVKSQKIISNDSVDWKNFGPGMSGYNETFVCHPNDANVMFMGPDMRVSFGSWDDGLSWQTIKDSEGTGRDMDWVTDIEFSLKYPDFGVATSVLAIGSASKGYVYETHDRGRSWDLVYIPGKKHREIAIHPTDTSIWFLGAGDFYNVKNNHKTLAKPHGILSGNAEYGYVLKTTDSGKSWKKVADNISDELDVAKIIFNPHHPDSMVMATSHGMFISIDGGDNWISSMAGLPNNLPRDLTSYYNKNTKEYILYVLEQTAYELNGNNVSTKGGIYKSLDGGVSWINVTGNLGINLNIVTNWWVRNRFKNTVKKWLGDASFNPSTFPSHTFSVFNRIAVNPLNQNEIYISNNVRHDAGFGPGEVWKTEDSGQKWFPCSRNGKYWLDETNKAYWQAKKSSVVGANMTFSHVQREVDEGSEGGGCRHMSINARGELFIGVGQQTLRSNDRGKSWQQIDDDEIAPGSNQWVGRGGSNLPGIFMLHETGIPDRRLLCSGEHGLWQTVDNLDYPDKDAVAVQQIEGQVHAGGAHTVSIVAVHPNNPDIIYIMGSRQTHRGKLRRTTDGGETWENIATIFEASNNESNHLMMPSSLIIDPVNPDNMYFCVRAHYYPTLTKGDYGVYHSYDGGFTWEASNSDFPDGSGVYNLIMDPDNPETLYASLYQNKSIKALGGLYKSTDKGISWQKNENLPSEITSVLHTFIDKKTKHMFISCGAYNGLYDAGGVWRSKDNGSTWKKIFSAPYVVETQVSPVNPNIIILSAQGQYPPLVDNFKNPGVYLSRDAGKSWIKINKGLGQPNLIEQVKPDPYNENILWCTSWGCGWFKALIKTNTVKAICADTEVAEGQELTLYGIESIGSQLNYEWSAPNGITLSSNNRYKTTFTAPEVENDSIVIIKLTVSNEMDTDASDILVSIKNDSKETNVNGKIFEQIHIYPNPVSNGQLRISSAKNNSLYSITNLQGMTVMSGIIEKNKIDVSKLNRGVYIMNIGETSKNAVVKFLVEN